MHAAVRWALLLALSPYPAVSGQPSTLTEAPAVISHSSLSTSSPPGTCRFGTVNYITHGLPQQCLRTNYTSHSNDDTARPAATPPSPASSPSSVVVVTQTSALSQPAAPTQHPLTNASIARPDASLTSSIQPVPGTSSDTAPPPLSSSSPPSSSLSSSSSAAPVAPVAPVSVVDEPSAVESDADSPLDHAKFLSFEDWKKQELEKVGQSPEAVASGGAAPPRSDRQRPGFQNALDSLGEDTEIEIDFSGFGNMGRPEGTVSGASTGNSLPSKAEPGSAPSDTTAPRLRNKDAGKTCKERFNYASFDCAANVLKTNSECKSSLSVLVENKDSYMLNKCSIDNKFLIVELCDRVLIDTVVLANYEFFSSMFRHFRVSVSDRYPVKAEKWKLLGTYEARNTREIQPFLVENPIIYARYLRIEFLSHYGAEYYCPLSLIRVHGTTMMEEYRRELAIANGELEEEEDPAVTVQDVVPVGVPTAVVGESLSVEPKPDLQATPPYTIGELQMAEPWPATTTTVTSEGSSAAPTANAETSALPSTAAQASETCPTSAIESAVPDEMTVQIPSNCSAGEDVATGDVTSSASQMTQAESGSSSTSSSSSSSSINDANDSRSSDTPSTNMAADNTSLVIAPGGTVVVTEQKGRANTSTGASKTPSAERSLLTDKQSIPQSIGPVSTASPSFSPPSLSQSSLSSLSTSSSSLSSLSLAAAPSSPPSSPSSSPSLALSVSSPGSMSSVSSSPSLASSLPPAVASSSSSSASVPAAAISPQPPATQESFFKSIHKRLQSLEANSTLSLQYIESQSALLREAFSKVEKRNVQKTSSFLDALNTTVLAELFRFKGDYEQLWQSTVIELANQREEGKRERELLGERVHMLAEEMVAQKRLMAAQATLLLLCLGLVIFGKFGASTGVDVALQGLVHKGRSIKNDSMHFGRRKWQWDRSPWASPPRSRAGEASRGEDGGGGGGGASSSEGGGSAMRNRHAHHHQRGESLDTEDSGRESDASEAEEAAATVVTRDGAAAHDRSSEGASGGGKLPLGEDDSLEQTVPDGYGRLTDSGQLHGQAAVLETKSAPTTPGVLGAVNPLEAVDAWSDHRNR